MEKIDFSTVITSVGGIIAALGGFELIKWFFNKDSNKRMMAAQAFEVEYKAIIADYKRVQEEIDQNKKQIEILNKKIDSLYAKVHDLESEKIQLIQENNEIKLQLKEAEKYICLQPDDKCLRRLNDNIRCRLVNLLRDSYKEDHLDAILTNKDMQGKENQNKEE